MTDYKILAQLLGETLEEFRDTVDNCNYLNKWDVVFTKVDAAIESYRDAFTEMIVKGTKEVSTVYCKGEKYIRINNNDVPLWYKENSENNLFLVKNPQEFEKMYQRLQYKFQ